MRRLICFVVIIIVAFTLCSCAPVINDCAQELINSSYGTTFDNGNSLSLSFSKYNATMKLKSEDNTVTLHGLCEISDGIFVIHDTKTLSSYGFEYIVYSDSVDITYADSTINLKKKAD